MKKEPLNIARHSGTFGEKGFHASLSRAISCPKCGEAISVSQIGLRAHAQRHVKTLKDMTEEQARDFRINFWKIKRGMDVSAVS